MQQNKRLHILENRYTSLFSQKILRYLTKNDLSEPEIRTIDHKILITLRLDRTSSFYSINIIFQYSIKNAAGTFRGNGKTNNMLLSNNR